MFRKIHSNPPPGATLGGEIASSLRSHLQRPKTALRRLLESRPKLSFGLMLAAMGISAIFVFWIGPSSENPQPAKEDATISSVFSSGMTGIVGTATALKDLVQLQRVVNGILEKKDLAPADSILLDSVLTEMERIQDRLKASSPNTP